MTIIITGDIEIGKTTVCQSVVELIKQSNLTSSGVLTVKREKDLFMQDIESQKEILFARRVRTTADVNSSRYQILKNGIDFRNCVIGKSKKSDVLIIDEIGPYELKNQEDQIFEWLSNKNNKIMLLVVRKKYLERIKRKLNCTVRVFKVTLKNRDAMPDNIFEWIKKSLGSATIH